MYDTFLTILNSLGFTPERAATCAGIFADNSLEGIYTHGVNRFPRFVSYIKQGYIKIDQQPVKKSGFGSVEQWNGNLGPGPLNALYASDRSMEIAQQYGIGCVALSNTNHWMRGGYYGWYTARKGFVFIGWTNTIANMPVWGATDARLGNNPLVIAIPFHNTAIVLDMAMSQYSYGALDLYSTRGQKLPTPGGYDEKGNLTDDASAIMESRRVLPIGYWKGSGLSLLLDILAAILSGGLSTSDITKQEAEHSLSQVFIVIDLSKLENFPTLASTLTGIIDDYHQAQPAPGKDIRYPGEHVLKIREANLKSGIPVSQKIWNEILALR